MSRNNGGAAEESGPVEPTHERAAQLRLAVRIDRPPAGLLCQRDVGDLDHQFVDGARSDDRGRANAALGAHCKKNAES